MPVIITPSTVTSMTWDDNPVGGTSFAKIVNNGLSELIVTDGNGRQVLFTTEPALLSHIKQVITDIEAQLAPAP